VFGYSPVRVPAGARPAVTETVARANFGLKVGKFELDLEDGNLRFQAAQILPDGELDEPTIQRLIGTTIAMLNVYWSAVLSLIYGNDLPADAIRHVEPRQAPPEESGDK